VRRGFFLPEKNLADHNWLPIGTLIHRDFFWELGGFDERTSHGLEDWELWSKADAAGARVVKVPDAVYIAHTRRVSSHAVYARTPEYGREYTRIRRSIHPELYA
jgi:GT2 family glycosyltransferase